MLQRRFGDLKGQIWQRTTKYFSPTDVADDVAVAVFIGFKDQAFRFLEESKRLGIPTLVVDRGWLRPDLGYWQTSVGGRWVPPPVAPSSDRFDKLRLKVQRPVERDYNTLLIGEKPGDPAHDLHTDLDVFTWASNVARYVRDNNYRRRVFWRPHVDYTPTLGRTVATLVPPERDFNSLIYDDYVGSAVVYNSHHAVQLLRQGVRVVALGPRTVYTDLVSSDLNELRTAHPGPDKVRTLLEKVAYGQYQLTELNWSVLERLFDLHGITGDW